MKVLHKIIYTLTDESPALSTFSLLPIISTFINRKISNIDIEICDISLSNRILSRFPENLSINQRVNDQLTKLYEIVKKKNANIIKLPNISASLPQLIEAIDELKNQGYNIPNYINNPKNLKEQEIKYRYDKIQGSAVNPILRDGNSNRYIPQSVKKFIKNYPPNIKNWSLNSKSHVSSMKYGDFYGTEKSIILKSQNAIKIVLITKHGKRKILRNSILTCKDDIIDASVMRKNALKSFIKKEIYDAKKQNVLLSLHLKSSMMKISDPIIFGTVVYEFYKPVILRYKKYLKFLKINLNNGICDLYKKIESLSTPIKNSIFQDIEKLYHYQPKLAMANYRNKITNLHIPNGIIIDSSMSDMIRNSGKMQGYDGCFHDTKAIIPDRCYSGIYKIMIDNCKEYGSFNPKTMGSMINVGLMAKAAEEYGSHDNTFQIPKNGMLMQVINNKKQVLIEHNVECGDIWRLCYTSNISIQNWIKLGIDETKKTNIPIIFWLDNTRPHDICLIRNIQNYLKHTNLNLNIKIMSPEEAMHCSIKYIRQGKSIISATGNVLRDYLTDLFPILELGTSSSMLSIIHLISGGMLFETGSGGSAPKHVQQFLEKNHFRWNSLGEFLALSASLEYIFSDKNHVIAKILSRSLNFSISKILKNNKLPSEEITKLDTRGSHFYLAYYWAEALSLQNENQILKKKFQKLFIEFLRNEKKIIEELNAQKGVKVDINGYYHPNHDLIKKIMCPSSTLNSLLNNSNY